MHPQTDQENRGQEHDLSQHNRRIYFFPICSRQGSALNAISVRRLADLHSGFLQMEGRPSTLALG